MEPEELAAWLRLTLTPGVGNATARRLLAAFGLPQAIFDQPSAALGHLVDTSQLAALRQAPPQLDALRDATLGWLAADIHRPDAAARRVVCLADPCYPASLLAMEDPPLLLYYLGGPAVSGQDSSASAAWFGAAFSQNVAIVGSRNPTPQGAVNARQFGRALAQAGLCIVSGLALGVDGAAHEGALEGVGPRSDRAPTIAVVGTGLDRVYPKGHLDLARRIAQRGLIISEFPIGTPPLAPNFPRRNRLIAGIGQATLVVEAALQSGSLITARLAVEQGKDVFAIPGSIHSAQSRGCHALIRQGAKLVESAQDVLEELGSVTGTVPLASAQPEGPPADDGALLRLLGFDPASLDALQARSGLPTAELQARLMALELAGHVARLPGGLFQRIAIA